MAQPQDAAADAAGAASTTEQQGQDEEIAAQMIQRNYRGYRERRQLQGIGLDASARWAEVRSAQKGTQVSSQ
jgi:predicted secreted protein